QPTTVDFSTLPSAVAARFPTSPCQRTTRSESAPTHPCRGDPTIARPPATAPPTCGPTVPARPTRRHDTALRSTGGVPSRPAPYPSNPSRWHEVAVRTRSRVTAQAAFPATGHPLTPRGHAVHPTARDVHALRAHDHRRTPRCTPRRDRAAPARVSGRGLRCPPPDRGHLRSRTATARAAASSP